MLIPSKRSGFPSDFFHIDHCPARLGMKKFPKTGGTDNFGAMASDRLRRPGLFSACKPEKAMIQ